MFKGRYRVLLHYVEKSTLEKYSTEGRTIQYSCEIVLCELSQKRERISSKNFNLAQIADTLDEIKKIS